MKFIDGLITGGLLVAVGVSFGKSSSGRPRHHRVHRHHRQLRRSRYNPQRRELEREMRLYLREVRELIRELRAPKIDAEFIISPNPANAEPKSPEPLPEAKE